MAYRADVIGFDHDSVLGPVLFQIRISSETRVHFTWHRFNAFKQLAEYLRHRFPDLPSLQPAGHLWERTVKVLNYATFLKERQQSLTAFLHAALSIDPAVEDVILREFLDIPSEPTLTRTAVEEIRSEAICTEATSSARPRKCSSADKFNESHRDRQRFSTGGYFRIEAEGDFSPRCQRCLSMPVVIPGKAEETERLSEMESERFNDCAVVIARDVARVFPSHARIQKVRLDIAEVLRSYARQDPELGYTQGMCFAAAVVCLGSGDLEEKQQRFSKLMSDLRDLWLPGFPFVQQGVPALEAMLATKDPELLHHLYHTVKLDLEMVVPGAWLSMFGKWLPVEVLVELVPFLQEQGLAGFVVVTFLVLLAHRSKLLAARSLEEVLPCINGLSNQPAPEKLLHICKVSMSQLRAGRDSMSWIAAM